MEWILCTERFPTEADGKVLVCYDNKGENVGTGRYSEYSKRWYHGDMCGVGGDDPIAWMPLPEPLKTVEKERANDLEPKEPIWTNGGGQSVTFWFECGRCKAPVDPSFEYCKKCGGGIIWDGKFKKFKE